LGPLQRFYTSRPGRRWTDSRSKWKSAGTWFDVPVPTSTPRVTSKTLFPANLPVSGPTEEAGTWKGAACWCFWLHTWRGSSLPRHTVMSGTDVDASQGRCRNSSRSAYCSEGAQPLHRGPTRETRLIRSNRPLRFRFRVLTTLFCG